MSAAQIMPPRSKHLLPGPLPTAPPRRLALALALLAAACAVAGCRKKPPPEPTATLRGRVVSANGRALAEVTLRLLTGDKVQGSVQEGKTGSDGAFSLTGVRAGRYLLRGELPGFSNAGVPVSLAAGETVATVLRLEPVQLLEGLVQDAQGRPLAQAALFAWPVGGKQVGVVEGISGADGRFALAGLTPGPWTLMVESPGFGTLRLERVDVPAQPLVLKLEGEARTLGGMVVAPDGSPVAQARVLLGGPAVASPREAWTDAKGLFVFHGLGFGRFVIRAVAGQRVSGNESVVIDEGTGWLPPVKLALGPGATLSGRVIDQKGNPLARAEVELTAPPAGDAFEIVRSDQQGRFTIGPVAPGRYQVWARAAGHALVSPPELELRADGAPRLDVRLARAAQLSGQVVDEQGKPLAGALVTVAAQTGLGVQDLAVLPGSLPAASDAANLPAEALTRKGRLRSTASGEGGRFLLPDLPPGPVRVEVTAAARLPVRRGPMDVEAGRGVDLGKLTLVAGVALAGRVLDEAGAPLLGARIEARQMDTGLPPFTAVADEEGKFVVYLPRGRVSVMASAAGRAPELRDPIVLDPAAPAPRLELRLQRADARLEGLVRDPQGRPANRARVLAYPLRGGAAVPDGGAPPEPAQLPPLSATSTDRSGRFVLQNVPKQPFLVEVRHAAWPARSAVAVPGQELFVDLPRPGAIEGDVRDRSSGAFVSTYRLSAVGPDGRAAVELRTLGAGFELKGLLPGRWKLRIQAPGYQAAERQVDVPPGAGGRNEASVRDLRVELEKLPETTTPPAPVTAGAATR
jgi:hypothetical protein